MVQRHETLSEVTSLHKEINKVFEQLAQMGRVEPGSLSIGEWFPRVDVFETRGSVMVKVEAPGFGKNDISVSFQGPKMILTGEKKQAKTGRSVRGYLCLERSFGKFTRSLYIDRAVDLTQAQAELTDGVLIVTLPKLKDRRGSEFRLTITETEGKTKSK